MPKGSFSVKMETIRVRGSRDNEYTLWVLGVSPRACDCPAFQYNSSQDCKHMRARRGEKAVGSTKCAGCRAWLTPEDVTSNQSFAVPEGAYTCSDCRAGKPRSSRE